MRICDEQIHINTCKYESINKSNKICRIIYRSQKKKLTANANRRVKKKQMEKINSKEKEKKNVFRCFFYANFFLCHSQLCTHFFLAEY